MSAPAPEILCQKLLAALPQPPTFTSLDEEREFRKFRLAQTYRIFGRLGYDDGFAGHITVRDPIKPGHFWVNPVGLHFKLIQPKDLLLVSSQAEVVDGGERRALNTAAFMIHSAIHEARPDVLCAAHSHSVYGRAFSAMGRKLDPISQESCAFYEHHAVYTEYNGIVTNQSEGQAIAKALGNNKAVILQNHGLIAVAGTIEAALGFYLSLEKACRIQLLVDACAARGPPVYIPEAQASATAAKVGSPLAGWHNGLIEYNLLESEEGCTWAEWKQTLQV